jgi:hypothetical protein
VNANIGVAWLIRGDPDLGKAILLGRIAQRETAPDGVKSDKLPSMSIGCRTSSLLPVDIVSDYMAIIPLVGAGTGHEQGHAWPNIAAHGIQYPRPLPSTSSRR